MTFLSWENDSLGFFGIRRKWKTNRGFSRSTVIQQVGEVRQAHFSHRKAKATCARLLLYFLRGSVKYPTPNARSRIQVRRSTYVRLGFRVPSSVSRSPCRSHVISPFRRHFRSYYINLTLKRHTVLHDDWSF